MECVRVTDGPTTHRKIAPLGLVVVTVVTLLFGLWPLNFHPENQVHWLDDRNGVQFHPKGALSSTTDWGLVCSAAAMDIPSEGDAFQPATIEICLEARREDGRGLSYILSSYDGDTVLPLIVAQWKSYLEIQCRNDAGSGNEYRGIDLKDALLKDVRVLLTITSRTDRTDIFVNGELARSFSIASLFGLEHFRGRLVLGNSPTGENPWVGNLYGLALYDRSLAPDQVRQNYLDWTGAVQMPAQSRHGPIILYTFDEREGPRVHNRVDTKNHLTIPRTYSNLKRDMLRPIWREIESGRGLAVDVIINIFGFVPFGLCMTGCLCQHARMPCPWALIVATLLGAILSLSIEMTQAALPGRCSSSLDLLCNTFGTALGVALFRATGTCERYAISARERPFVGTLCRNDE